MRSKRMQRAPASAADLRRWAAGQTNAELKNEPIPCQPQAAFVNGYMIDILLPFAMFLLLGVAKQSILRNGIARGIFVFAIGAVTETLQYFGVPIFGRTFDLLDYLMFGVGIGLAAVFERSVLSRIPGGIPPRPSDNIR